MDKINELLEALASRDVEWVPIEDAVYLTCIDRVAVRATKHEHGESVEVLGHTESGTELAARIVERARRFLASRALACLGIHQAHDMGSTKTHKITARVTRYEEDREAEVAVQIGDREPGSCLLLWEAQNDRWVWHGDGLDCWADDEVQSWVLGLPSDFYGAACDVLKSACLSALDRYEAGEDIELGDVVETFVVEEPAQ